MASDPAFAEALRHEDIHSMTPARMALLAFAKAWTYPVRGNEDVLITNGLFEQARALAKNAAVRVTDPPEFAGWLEILRDKPGRPLARMGGHAARGGGLFRAKHRPLRWGGQAIKPDPWTDRKA